MLAALSVFKLRVKKCPLVAATYDRSLFPVFRNDRNGLNCPAHLLLLLFVLLFLKYV